jgi:arylsulfatase A-like enzyme
MWPVNSALGRHSQFGWRTAPGLGCLALGALLLVGACKHNPKCCDTPDCSGGSDKIVGSDVLKFKGRVPQNLLFLSIDTLRKDVMEAHGGGGVMPFIDEVSREGVVMMDHHQCSNWTLAGMTCTLAGAYDTDRGHQTRLVGTESNRPPIPAGTPFLATWLADVGYHTAAVTSNTWFGEKWGIHQGYEKFGNPPGSGGVAGSRGLSFLRALLGKDDDPWFLHLHFVEPHAPYDSPDSFMPELADLEPWPDDLSKKKTHYQHRGEWPGMPPEEQDLLEQHLRVRYAGNIRELDGILEDTWTDYDKKCWLDDTLVVVWNDHGEAFWEHGFQTHAYNLSAEESDGILMFWSKNIVAGQWDEPTSAIDLAPTLLDLFGVPIPPEITGQPVGSAAPDRSIFAATIGRVGGVQSIIKSGIKLQYHWKGAAVRMWDRNADPFETEDLYNANNREALSLWELLLPEVERMAGLVVNEEPAPNWPDDLPAPAETTPAF